MVSIIMPSYNCGKYIAESIQSVINQTYSDWELLIIDDCSTDNTKDIVNEFKDKRIRYLRNKKNSGAAVSRNYGLREAKGEWIAFLDSDDLWNEKKLELQLSFMIDNNYKFSCSYCSYIDEKSNLLGKVDLCPKHITKGMNYLYNWIASQTVMYHAPTIGLVQIEDLKKRNDYALWLKVFRKASCECYPQVLASYRIRGQSISHDKFWKLIKSHYVLFRKGERLNPVVCMVLTCFNMIFGLIRKVFFVRRVK